MGLKVLHLIDSGGLYGAEVVLLTLMEQQARMGLRTVLGSFGAPGEGLKPVEGEALRRGLSVRRFGMTWVPGSTAMREILRTIREEEIDVVHTHGYKPDVLLGFLPRVLRPVAVVATLHGWCGRDGFSKLRLYEWLDARALAFLDGVAVVSQQMLDRPGLSGRRLPLLRVIPNGSSPAPPIAPTRNGPDPVEDFCRRMFTYGSIGRLSPEKDYATLLRAFSSLRERDLDVQLLILGDGSDRPDLTDFIRRRGLGDRVLLPGYVAGARRYLAVLGAYVQSSLTEGMPVSILEAMAAGVPIVATAVGGVPEMLDQGRAGLLVPPGDPQLLAAAMEGIFLNPAERQNLAESARRNSAIRYSAEGMARAYMEFYKDAIARRGS